MSRSRKNIQPNWRPNFVTVADLPDIKVIRTGFVINFFSLVLMLLVGFAVLQREYRVHVLNQTIADIEQRIRVADADDARDLSLSGEFRNAAAHIVEVEKFYAQPFFVQDFLIELTQMRPEQLIFQQLSLVESFRKEGSEQTITYRINIAGDVRSLTVLDQFKGELSNWHLLNRDRYALRIDESLEGRDPNTGIFPYILQITLEPVQGTSSGDA